MEGFGSGYRGSGAADRRVEIMSGKGNQMRRSPDLVRYPPGREAAAAGGGGRAQSTAAAEAVPWGFGDPEMKRRKRIAKYKVYAVEGRIKASIKRGFRWIKNRCSEIVNGF